MENYDLELDKTVFEIRKQKAKRVCIQLPDGLKPKAKEIADQIRKNTDAEPIIWLGTCFGACDIPDLGNLKPDLLIQWGHSKWSQ
jgi:2-(3-amino-3-carboxypropyl)histidine synthase